MTRKTVIFENKYGENIDHFKTAEEIDAFMKKNGHTPKVTKNIPVLITKNGKMIYLKDQDINSKFKTAISRASTGVGFLSCLTSLFR